MSDGGEWVSICMKSYALARAVVNLFHACLDDDLDLAEVSGLLEGGD